MINKTMLWTVDNKKVTKIGDGVWHPYKTRTTHSGFPAGTECMVRRHEGSLHFQVGDEIRTAPGNKVLVGIECAEEDGQPTHIDMLLAW